VTVARFENFLKVISSSFDRDLRCLTLLRTLSARPEEISAEASTDRIPGTGVDGLRQRRSAGKVTKSRKAVVQAVPAVDAKRGSTGVPLMAYDPGSVDRTAPGGQMNTRKRVRHRATHEVSRSSIVDIQARLRAADVRPLPPPPPVVDEAEIAAPTADELEQLLASAELDLDAFLSRPRGDDRSEEEVRLAEIDARLAELESGLEEFFTRLEPAARRRVVNAESSTDASVADLQRAIDQRLVKRRRFR
jgi:hypothetical protein